MAARKSNKDTNNNDMPVKVISPSRARDYLQCPKLFFYKTVLGIATPPTTATLRGTLAHYVFEHIFDHPAGERGPATALEYIEPAWRMTVDPLVERATVPIGSPEDRLRSADRRYRDLHEPGSATERRLLEEATSARTLVPLADEAPFLDSVRAAVVGWYEMEKPDKFTPTDRERYVRAKLGKVPVHGYIDRLDVVTLSSGATRTYVSDYKTGKKPSPRFEDEAFFQLEVYAAALLAADGIKVDELRLLYTNEGRKDSVIKRRVDQAALDRVHKKVAAVWDGIAQAHRKGVWPTRKQTLCDWCYFKPVCPAWHPELEGMLPEEIEYRLGSVPNG